MQKMKINVITLKKKKKVFLWKGRRDLSKRVAEGSDTAVKGNYLSFQ